MKTTTHKGLTCVFTEADHSYRIKETGGLLTPVTTFIKKVTRGFDSVKMAKKMIDDKNKKYIGMTAQEIQQQWKKKAEFSSFEGSELHALLERWPEKGRWGWHPKTMRLLAMGKQVEKLFTKLLERFRLVASEQIIFSQGLGLAGQVDLIMADDTTNEGILIDWKTNEKITDEAGAFGSMLPPIEHLADCDTVKYGLQLGLYEKILKTEAYYPEFTGYRKSLIHISGAISKVVKVKDYRKEIECLML